MSSEINEDYKTEASNILSAALDAFLKNNGVEQENKQEIVNSLTTIVQRSKEDIEKLDNYNKISQLYDEALEQIKQLEQQDTENKATIQRIKISFAKGKNQFENLQKILIKRINEKKALKVTLKNLEAKNSLLTKQIVKAKKEIKQTADLKTKLQQELENLKSQANVLKVQQLEERIRELSTLNTQLQKCSNYKPITNRYFVI